MTENIDDKELANFKELLIAKAIQIDVLTKLLIKKGVFTQEEFSAELKQVQTEYEQ